MLTKMRYKSFVWPHNPSSYSISFARNQAVHALPMGDYQIQDLGRTCRIMKGEGAFYGPDAYRTFQALARLFDEGTPGVLIHPVWQTSLAYLSELELLQEPRADYVRYRFTFREAGAEARQETITGDAAPKCVIFREGDTMLALAGRCGLTMDALAALNPEIGNFSHVTAGQEVRVR